jgi:hypothetical protein
MLFYNSQTRAGATGRFDNNGTFRTLKVFPNNSFGAWTHIALDHKSPNGYVLFYNATNGSGHRAIVEPDGSFSNQQALPGFGLWTHVVPTYWLNG